MTCNHLHYCAMRHATAEKAMEEAYRLRDLGMDGVDWDCTECDEPDEELVIRYSASGHICIVWDAADDRPVRAVTQEDMDMLSVGEDLTDEEIELLDD